jgi:AraC-like DNA-binding protein
MRMNRIAVILFALLACVIPGQAGNGSDLSAALRMTVERLPDLNVPRGGHTAAFVNGELTVIGGHTTGFVPTLTAEYYRDGAWHLVETLYPHDFGFGVVLPSEEVLVGGGCSEPFGVGQTFGVELYDPETHGFDSLPILDRKTGARTNAARLSDGRIIVAGSWYAGDAVSAYSLETGGSFLFNPTVARSMPFILQSAPDNALILSSLGSRDEACAAVADRLQGGPVEVPLLREWTDWGCMEMQQMSQFFIGEERVGGYAWLFPALRKEDGQLGLIKVIGEAFSVLETEEPLAMESPEGAALTFPACLIDKTEECAWLVQSEPGTERIYATRVDYGLALQGGRAPVARYAAELPDGLRAPVSSPPVLLSGGRIAFVGGLEFPDNYHPDPVAFILHTEPMPRKAAFPWWIVLVGGLLTVLAVLVWLIRRPRPLEDENLRPAQEDNTGTDFAPATGSDLLSRIVTLMEGQELWRQKGLKVSDLATRLGTNATYISACINGQTGKSFPEFIGDYRVRHAQRLLLEHPDMLLADIAEESGFSNEQSFFRTFKARTGLTPQEWKAM